MSVLLESFKICSRCLGSGTDDNSGEESTPCVPCSGTGKVRDGWVDVEDLMDLCNDILDKCNDILDKVSQ